MKTHKTPKPPAPEPFEIQGSNVWYYSAVGMLIIILGLVVIQIVVTLVK